MPSTFTHLFISVVLLLIFSYELKISKKFIILMSFFSIFPDIDMFLFHRATLHNVFILLIPIIIYYFYRNILFCSVMAYYLLSHIILDMFSSGVYLFYPFYDKVIYIMSGLSYDEQFKFYYEIIVENGLSLKTFNMAIISSENVGTIVLTIILVIMLYLIKHKDLNIRKDN